MPSCWATAPPYGSASTSTVGGRRRASSAARPTAMVVRPGAPAGPHTAITRPAGRPEWPASAPPVLEQHGVPGRLGRSGATAGHDRVGEGDQVVLAPAPARRSGSPAARPRRAPRRPGTTATGRTPWARRWSTAATSSPGASTPRTADVGLAGRRPRQQVVDVDAALEHHDVRRARSAPAVPPDSHGAPAATSRTTTTSAPTHHGQRAGSSVPAHRRAKKRVGVLLGDRRAPAAASAGRAEASRRAPAPRPR